MVMNARAEQPTGRMIRPLFLGAAALAVGACSGAAPMRAVPQADLAAELVVARGDQPPAGPPGACWARDVTPAVIETEMRQDIVAPARTAEDGTPVPATFRSVTQQRIVQDRREVWFRTPCEADMTVAFIATLQRALKARGLYGTPVTGIMDDATRLAIRRFQAPQGLDSTVLSLAAARDLGLTAADPQSY